MRILRTSLIAILIAAAVLNLYPRRAYAFITGTITSATCPGTGCVQFPLSPEVQSVTIQLAGTWTATVVFEATVDGAASWFAINAGAFPAGTAVSATGANGQWNVSTAGFDAIRLRASAFTSGTINVTIETSIGIQNFGSVITVSVGSGTPRNANASATAAAATVTIAAVAGQTVHIQHISATCSAGTATLIVQDGGTTVLSYAASGSFAFPYGFPGLSNTAGNNMVVTLGTCGATNVGTLNVAAVQY